MLGKLLIAYWSLLWDFRLPEESQVARQKSVCPIVGIHRELESQRCYTHAWLEVYKAKLSTFCG